MSYLNAPNKSFQFLYFYGPVIFGDSVNLKMEAVRGPINKGMVAGVGPLLGEGTRRPVRSSYDSIGRNVLKK